MQTRNLNNKNILSFQEKLENLDWSFMSAIQNVDSAYGSLLDVFKRHFDECCPFQTKKRKLSSEPALLKSSKTKDKLFKRYQESPTVHFDILQWPINTCPDARISFLREI